MEFPKGQECFVILFVKLGGPLDGSSLAGKLNHTVKSWVSEPRDISPSSWEGRGLETEPITFHQSCLRNETPLTTPDPKLR